MKNLSPLTSKEYAHFQQCCRLPPPRPGECGSLCWSQSATALVPAQAHGTAYGLISNSTRRQVKEITKKERP